MSVDQWRGRRRRIGYNAYMPTRKTSAKRSATKTTAPKKAALSTPGPMVDKGSPTWLTTAIRILASASLPATVFITGAAVLILEVTATRILSPYFGNSIYTVSSVLSVVLAALSVGYAIGGKLADRRPHIATFYGIIAAAGLGILLTELLSKTFLHYSGQRLPITYGPLVSGMVLFFLPSLLLGMLSPFAVKLSTLTRPAIGVGAAAGSIFFWSTLGSIAGSLGAGFVLVPHVGLSAIIIGTGCVLVALGLVPLLLAHRVRASIMVFAIFMTIVTTLPTVQASQLLYSRDGIYEKVQVYDGQYNGHPTRFFSLDRAASGAMYLDSDELVYPYTKYYSLYTLLTRQVNHALVIGGGAYSIPKALLSELPRAQVDVSEIEPSLPQVAKQYFNLPSSPNLHLSTTDGRRLLADTTTQYDLIFSDVYYSLYSIPQHFATKEFFTLAKSKLAPGGFFVANIIGNLSRQTPSLTLSEMRTFQQAFPNSYFFAVDSPAEADNQNIMFVGYNSDTLVDFSQIAASDNPNHSVLQQLAQRQIDPARFELSAYPVLTDDYAPVDYMTAANLSRSFALQQHQHDDGKEMMALIAQQLRYGARYPTAPGHQQLQQMISSELAASGAQVTNQPWTHTGIDGSLPLTNIVGRFYPDRQQRIVVGVHYDTKRYASLDPIRPDAAMPGANDAASGVAVLLQTARYLPDGLRGANYGVDLVFFDGEEGDETVRNDYAAWYPLGSKYFADNLTSLYPAAKPQSGIVLDMVCDKDLQLTWDNNSAKAARANLQRFWDIGKTIDARAFTNNPVRNVIDDHTALNDAGVPTFDVIDFDYPAFHTTRDTVDQCSAKSLETIATTLQKYLLN